MSVPFVTSPLLERAERISHGFFGRRGGQSTGDFASLNVSETGGDVAGRVAANRADAARALDFKPDRLVTLTQVHSNRVLTLDALPAEGTRPEADAVVTGMPDVALGILTADCAPILLCDPQAGVVAAAHAGWKGAMSGIVGSTIEAMQAIGARLEHIVAAIGPTISLDSYEVGPDFVDDLLAGHPEAASRVSRPAAGGREHFDLPGYVLDQLRGAGIGLVHQTSLCTYADPTRYFSHRRATHQGTTTGRQISIIGRR